MSHARTGVRGFEGIPIESQPSVAVKSLPGPPLVHLLSI